MLQKGDVMRGTDNDVLIQRYLSGDLSGEECRVLERRFEQEQALRDLLHWYQALGQELHELPDPEIPEGLWRRKISPALEEHLGKRLSFSDRLFGAIGSARSLLMKPAVAILAIIALVVGVTLLVQPMINVDETLSPEQQRAEQTITEIQDLRDEVLVKLNELSAIMDERKSELSIEMLKVYEDTLTKIDEGIAEAERYFFAYPEDPDAVKLLFVAYERKGQFIQQFINMDI